MARKTQYNIITNEDLIKDINPENIRLMDDFLMYLNSIQRSQGTIKQYKADLNIFFVWNLQNNRNKFFVDVSKRDIVAFQNWLINVNKNSPARVRRMKSTLSSLSNYIENILDDEYDDFKPIIRKIENPKLAPVRDKTVFTDEQLDMLLDTLLEKGKIQQACVVALAMCCGARKSELLRFKVSYFDEENVLYDSLYKTPEKILTKGNKYLHKYVLKHKFDKYLNLWLKQRAELGVENEYLFVHQNDAGEYVPLTVSTLDAWADSFSKILNMDFYFHSLRHYFTTHLSRENIPDSIIQSIVGWASLDMVSIYKDIDAEEEFGKYFGADGIQKVEQKSLTDL